MSVCKKVQFPSKVICAAAATSCAEEDMAVATDEGIYILTMRTCPEHASSEMVMHISKIEPDPEVNEFNVDIDRDTVQQDIIDSGEIVGDFFEIMLNRTLSPAVESLQCNRGFVKAAWSASGADIVGRRVLATLTGDHRVSIFSRHGTARKWEDVVQISQMFQELMTNESFCPAEERIKRNKLTEKSKIVRLKERTYLLAGVALSWSKSFDEPAINVSDGSPPLKKQKSEDVETRCICFLATALKSGHIGIWKIRLPVISKKEVTFSELVDLHTTCPKTIHWCEKDDGAPGFLAVGYQDGLVKLLHLKWLPGSMDLTAGEEPGEAWSDPDNIPVHAISWDSKLNILYFAKGPYLFATVVKVSESGEFTIGKESHIAVSPTVFVNDIRIRPDSVWASTGDDLVIMVKTTLENDDSVQLKLGLHVEPPRDLSGILYPWKNHGFTWSHNGAFIGILSSPGWNYCHLEIRKALKFDILSRITPEEATDMLLEPASTATLADYTDVLMYTKQVYRSTGNLPDILEMLVKDVEGWDTLSLFNMKLLRFLLLMEDAHCKENPTRKNELKELIPKATDLVLGTTACQSLKSIQKQLTKKCTFTGTERLAVYLMCTWVMQNGSEDEDKARAKAVAKVVGHVEQETCIICQKTIPFTSIQDGCCSNGHRFGRCSQTLVLCQDLPYRGCSGCTAVAIHRVPDSLLLRDVFGNACSLCDNTLLFL